MMCFVVGLVGGIVGAVVASYLIIVRIEIDQTRPGWRRPL